MDEAAWHEAANMGPVVMQLITFIAACVGLLGGCVAGELGDPIAVMTDHQAGYNKRRTAAIQAESQFLQDPKRIAALEKILWMSRYPAWQRCYAVDQLVVHDEQAFRRSLLHRFNLLRDVKTINHIFNLAIDRKWRELTPIAVQNYAQYVHGVADKDRTERRVIAQLNPGRTVEDVIFDIFCIQDSVTSTKDRIAAWELLFRLVAHESLIGRLMNAPDTDPLVTDLKAAASLHLLPSNREELLWLLYIRDPQRQSFWRSSVDIVRRLQPEQRQGLALRHLPVLATLSTDQLALGRKILVEQIDATIHNGSSFMAGPTYDGQMERWPQRFSHWRQSMCWADLIAVDWLLSAMHDRRVVAEIFRQADADHQDIGTEYGGVVSVVDGRPAVKGYEPMYRQHDRKFIPPQEMIEHLYQAVAHYHFHAQKHKNSRYAGPGDGDIKLANRLQFNFLVFTFIDRDRLNVDYYQPGRVVIDLGTVRR